MDLHFTLGELLATINVLKTWMVWKYQYGNWKLTFRAFKVYGGQFILSTQFINPKFCVSLPFWRSAIVSLGRNPFKMTVTRVIEFEKNRFFREVKKDLTLENFLNLIHRLFLKWPIKMNKVFRLWQRREPIFEKKTEEDGAEILNKKPISRNAYLATSNKNVRWYQYICIFEFSGAFIRCLLEGGVRTTRTRIHIYKWTW